MAPGFIFRRKSDNGPRPPPRFTKVAGCYLVMGVIFAIICITISACSPYGFRGIDISTTLGCIELVFIVLCVGSFLLFISKLLPICAANVNLVDPPTGDRTKRSQSRSSSELSLANRNKNNGSRRGSTVSISTPYDHFASAVRRPSTSSTVLVTPTQARAENGTNQEPSQNAPPDPFESFTGLNVESLPPPPAYDSINKISTADVLSITDMPSPKHIKSNLCSKCATAQANEEQNISEHPIVSPPIELLDQVKEPKKSEIESENNDSSQECLNVCPKCGTINVMEADKH